MQSGFEKNLELKALYIPLQYNSFGYDPSRSLFFVELQMEIDRILWTADKVVGAGGLHYRTSDTLILLKAVLQMGGLEGGCVFILQWQNLLHCVVTSYKQVCFFSGPFYLFQARLP